MALAGIALNIYGKAEDFLGRFKMDKLQKNSHNNI